MNIKKLFLSLLPLTQVAIIAPMLSSCAKDSQVWQVTFKAGPGGSLYVKEGIELEEVTLNIKNGTQWKDIALPKYKCESHYHFWGWTDSNGELIKTDSLVVSSNITINATFFFTDARFSYARITEDTVSIVGIETREENIIIPPFVTEEGISKYKVVQVSEELFFSGCESVKSVEFPYTMEHIPAINVANAPNLQTYKVDPNNQKFTSRDSKGNECNCIIDIANKKIICGAGDYTIPDDGSVESIGSRAFKCNQHKITLIIPNTIKTLDGWCFERSSLTEVIIPNSIDSTRFDHGFGEGCFLNCHSLTKITIKEGLKHIGQSTFYGCTALKKVSLPDSLSNDSLDGLFGHCTSLEEVKLPSQLKQIGVQTFLYCKNLKNIEIPQTLEAIKSQAFCVSGITKFPVPANVKRIDDNFFSASDITEIKVDPDNPFYTSCDSKGHEINGVMKINNGEPTELIGVANFKDPGTTMTIPDTIKVIKKCAFFQVKNLKKVIIGDSVETLETYAFRENDIEEFEIGKNLKTIDEKFGNTFYGCNKRKKITVHTDNPYFTTQDADGKQCNCLMDKARTKIYLACYDNTQTSIEGTIPESVTVCLPYSFSMLEGLKSFDYFEGFENIKEYAQWAIFGNSEVEEFTIGENVEKIGWSSFTYWSSLKDLHIKKELNSWPAGWDDTAVSPDGLAQNGTIHVTCDDQELPRIKNYIMIHWGAFIDANWQVVKETTI